MEIKEIEHEIACGGMRAPQVFTQMLQHISAYKRLAKERGEFIVNGEDLGYISTPASENDKAYHIFLRCKIKDELAVKV